MAKKYTWRDVTGMKWRMEGSRPISSLADIVMGSLEVKKKKKKRKKK